MRLSKKENSLQTSQEGIKMKKTRMAAATAMALTVAMGMSAFAAEADLPSADVAEQGYDFYDQAVSYNDLRETLGAIPKLDEEITIGFATKTFENEFWRTQIRKTPGIYRSRL